MNTLEQHLRDRLTDSRAMTAVLDINADRVLLKFGAIGPLSGIVLQCVGNELFPRVPDDLANAWAKEDAAKRARPDPNNPDGPAPEIATIMGEDGGLTAGEGGPAVNLPNGVVAVEEDRLAELMDRLEKAEANGGNSTPENGGDDAGGTDAPDGGETGATDGDTPKDEAPKVEPVNPSDHLRTELIAMAKKAGAEFSEHDDNKAEIAAAIDKARAAKAAG